MRPVSDRVDSNAKDVVYNIRILIVRFTMSAVKHLLKDILIFEFFGSAGKLA